MPHASVADVAPLLVHIFRFVAENPPTAEQYAPPAGNGEPGVRTVPVCPDAAAMAVRALVVGQISAVGPVCGVLGV